MGFIDKERRLLTAAIFKGWKVADLLDWIADETYTDLSAVEGWKLQRALDAALVACAVIRRQPSTAAERTAAERVADRARKALDAWRAQREVQDRRNAAELDDFERERKPASRAKVDPMPAGESRRTGTALAVIDTEIVTERAEDTGALLPLFRPRIGR